MTLVLGVANGLQQLQFGFNELASALVIGKIVGTAFTLQTDAEVFNILEYKYEVRLKAIPDWMRSFQFSRTGVIHGHGMRRLNCSSLMDNIDVESLQGFASMVVLCCRYAMTTDVIVRVLEGFLGSGQEAIFPGKLADHGTRLSMPMKALLANFVRATMDSDANSQQAGDVVKWMADLASDVGISTKIQLTSRRAHEQNRLFIAKLMGDTKPTEGAEDGLPREPGQRVEHTLSMATASIALAAAANGAVSVSNASHKMVLKLSHNVQARQNSCCVSGFVSHPWTLAISFLTRRLSKEEKMTGHVLKMASTPQSYLVETWKSLSMSAKRLGILIKIRTEKIMKGSSTASTTFG